MIIPSLVVLLLDCMVDKIIKPKTDSISDTGSHITTPVENKEHNKKYLLSKYNGVFLELWNSHYLSMCL